MFLKRRFISDQSGASLLLVALMLPVLLAVVGITVDLGKIYAVQSKAQGALDAALLGAAVTANSTAVSNEVSRLFRGNYPEGYMGASVSAISVTPSMPYKASLIVRVPSSMMQLFGFKQTEIAVTSVVSNISSRTPFEVALVIDNSKNVDVKSLKVPTRTFVGMLFAADEAKRTRVVSFIPFNVGVRVGLEPENRLKWAKVQGNYKGNGGVFANRNDDIPPDKSVDVSDAAPGSANELRFRTPYGVNQGDFDNGDGATEKLFSMLFGSNNFEMLSKYIEHMDDDGATRLNVGLMWGWFALSEKWTGMWDAGLPALPLSYATTHKKMVVMVVASRNNVYLGGQQACGKKKMCDVSDDNKTMLATCTAMKQQGIAIYMIGFGKEPNYNIDQLKQCSSGDGYYFTAVNDVALLKAYQQIIDNMNYSSLRLSQ